MKKETITKLLNLVLGAKIVYFVLVIMLTIFQEGVKTIFNGSNDNMETFVLPIDTIVNSTMELIITVVFVLAIKNTLKLGKNVIYFEVIGSIFLGGALWIISCVLHIFVTQVISKTGANILINYISLYNCLAYLDLISRIFSVLFVLACGMSIAYKKDAIKYLER